MEKIVVDADEIQNMDLSRYEGILSRRRWSKINKSNEHYKFLAWLSSQYRNFIIIELGGKGGLSALMLAHEPSNKVVSYDISRIGAYKQDNILHRIADATKLSSNIYSAANIIFLDISHNGFDETKVLETIDKSNFKGLLIMDDINTPTRFPDLHEVWNNIPQRKQLVKEGHFTGTGLVYYE